VLLEQIAHGSREPPVLAVEMLNPVHDARALLQVVIVMLVAGALILLAHSTGALTAAGLAIVALAALPASIAVMALGDDKWHALHPLVLWRTAHAQGGTYLIVIATALAYGALLWLAARADLWLLAQLMLGVFAWLSCYALIGGGIFEHRDALGHEPIDSPERRAARRAGELEQTRKRFLDTVYFQARGVNLTDAWNSIERELAAHGYPGDYADWLLDRLGQLDDRRLADRLAQHELTRALASDNTRAIRLVQRALALDAAFRPRSAAETLRAAQLMRLAGDRSSARKLLADFEQHFPGDAAIAQANALAQTLQ